MDCGKRIAGEIHAACGQVKRARKNASCLEDSRMAFKMEIKKILVRAPNWIGDSVMCLPAMESLKALFPSSEITVLTRSRSIPVFKNNPCVKDIIEHDGNGRHKGIGGRLRLARELKDRGFDLAVLFQNAFDAAFVSFAAGIPERAGYARDLRSGFLTKAIRVTDEIKKKHQVFYYLNIVENLGGSASSCVPRIYLSDDESAWADEFIKKNGLAGECLVGAAPAASYGPAKRWGAGNFAGVLTMLSESFGGVTMIFGGKEDAELCAEVSAGLKHRHLNVAGIFDLRQFMAILTRLKVFITNDSGPMHISAALDVPTVAIFGSTDPGLTGPLSERSRVLIKKTECSPCFERSCRYGHYKCLRAISTGEVFRATQGLMKSGVPEHA